MIRALMTGPNLPSCFSNCWVRLCLQAWLLIWLNLKSLLKQSAGQKV